MTLRRRALGLASALPITIAALAGCSEPGEAADAQTSPPPSASPSPKIFTASGYLELITADGMNYLDVGDYGETCWGEGGYDDIDAGAQVVVKSSKGQVLGFGHLEEGYLRDEVTCRFDFTVPEVLIRGNVYSVEVADRGEVLFRLDEADDLALSLGDLT